MNTHRRSAALVIIAAAACARPARAQAVRPFERDDWPAPANQIDEKVLALLRDRGISPARPCSDEVFVRRVYFDAIGTLPTAAEVRRFLEDSRPEKRAELIDSLLKRDEFADYWAMKWCDTLRVKAEFPINLWPNAVQAYHRWIRDAVAQNRPYDQFARELLTSSGSNFRSPPVNFYRALQGRDAAAVARAVALTFMGTRLESWPPDRRRELEAFFSRVAYKPTAEWKEEIVCLDPAPADARHAVFPDGPTAHLAPNEDPRRIFADWLVRRENPWFARAAVNRVWAWLMGRGIVHEPDDLRPDNPPSNPELLACLEREFTKSGYDFRHILRLILNSRTYQQSSLPRAPHPDAQSLFAYYVPRRLDAEVLIDALCQLSGVGESYSSPIPEPYTIIPEGQRTIALADGSITSPFLELFGRPARDTGLWSERNNQWSDAQRLHLLNSTHIQRKIENSRLLAGLIDAAGRDRRRLIREIYLSFLSRYPTAAELAATERIIDGKGAARRQAVDDLAWVLINSKEFLFRH